MALSTFKGEHIKKNLRSDEHDLIIIGSGITGADITLGTSEGGMKVALVEMQGFAQGTNSRSTKLVHGGLRYLKQFQIEVVAETGKKRAIVYENGPHVTTPEWMPLPMHKGGTLGKFSTSIDLGMYDRLAGVKRSERKKMLSKKGTLAKESLVKEEDLEGDGCYVEYRASDACLTIEVMRRAAEKGAEVINYTKSEYFTYDRDQQVNGVSVINRLTNENYTVKAKKVINAMGPRVNNIRSGGYTCNNKKLRLTKGIHVIIDRSEFPLGQAVYFGTEGDGRIIFIIPRKGKACVGAADTFYDSIKSSPLAIQEDRNYLIDAINCMFPSVNVTNKDVESTWAGIRPLIYGEDKDPSKISRRDEIWEGKSGLLTIADDKLTGYHHMAQDIIDLVSKRLKKDYGLTFSPCNTKGLAISGGDVGDSKNFDASVEQKVDVAKGFGINESVTRRLASKYSSNAGKLFNIAQISQCHDSKLPLEIYVELVYSIQQKMIYEPNNLLVRRPGKMYFNIKDVLDYKDNIVDIMADILDYSPAQIEAYTEEVEQAIEEAQHGNNQPTVKE